MFPPPPESVAWLGRTLVGVVAVGGPADCLPAGGLHGEGMLPIPEKVVKKILELAFVDGRPHADEGSLSVEERFNTLADGSGITDVGQWVQCFAGLVSVLSTTSGTGTNGEMFPGLPRRGMGSGNRWPPSETCVGLGLIRPCLVCVFRARQRETQCAIGVWQRARLMPRSRGSEGAVAQGLWSTSVLWF